MKKITTNNINEWINNGKLIFDYVLVKIAENVITNERAIGFNEAIEIGIEKTITSLYNANIKDEQIRNIVNKQWGIDGEETDKRLNNIKANMTINSLKEYLKRQGYSKNKIIQMFRENQVAAKIRRDETLWKLKDKPENLYEMFFN